MENKTARKIRDGLLSGAAVNSVRVNSASVSAEDARASGADIGSPFEPLLVALRVVNAQLCGFRPIAPSSLWRETGASQSRAEAPPSENDEPSSTEENDGATVETALADATLPNSPSLGAVNTDEAVEFLSGDKQPLDAATSQPRPPFSISAGGLSNEAAYIRAQYAGIQHALSQLSGYQSNSVIWLRVRSSGVGAFSAVRA